MALWRVGSIRPRNPHKQDLKPSLCGTTFWGEALMGVWPVCLRFSHLAPAMVLALISLALQEKNARLLGAAQQLVLGMFVPDALSSVPFSQNKGLSGRSSVAQL